MAEAVRSIQCGEEKSDGGDGEWGDRRTERQRRDKCRTTVGDYDACGQNRMLVALRKKKETRLSRIRQRFLCRSSGSR
uniref:Uncharacterized protein n=1 Tax=Ditylenchus dipsaci TaxID=166011 RepID=A0A915CM38_9BILA